LGGISKRFGNNLYSNDMKCFLLFTLALMANSAAMAQADIAGEWYSADSSRVYKVYRHGAGYAAILLHSTRSGDRQNAPVLQDVMYQLKKNRYKGVILANSDSTSTIVKLSYSDAQRRVLKLRLRRFFIGRTTIWWYRR
jgi:hypothetical protein